MEIKKAVIVNLGYDFDSYFKKLRRSIDNGLHIKLIPARIKYGLSDNDMFSHQSLITHMQLTYFILFEASKNEYLDYSIFRSGYFLLIDSEIVFDTIKESGLIIDRSISSKGEELLNYLRGIFSYENLEAKLIGNAKEDFRLFHDKIIIKEFNFQYKI